MDGILLQEDFEHQETLLGVKIDANLKWHGQVGFLLEKLKTRLAGLAHVRHVLPYHVRKIVADGLFSSVLVYCLPLFGGCDAGEVQALQILQNRAAQMVPSQSKETSCVRHIRLADSEPAYSVPHSISCV